MNCTMKSRFTWRYSTRVERYAIGIDYDDYECCYLMYVSLLFLRDHIWLTTLVIPNFC